MAEALLSGSFLSGWPLRAERGRPKKEKHMPSVHNIVVAVYDTHAWIVGALEAPLVVGGLSAIGASLFSIGLYELALKSDKFLILAHRTTERAARGRDIINRKHPTELHMHLRSLQHAADGREHAVAIG